MIHRITLILFFHHFLRLMAIGLDLAKRIDVENESLRVAN